MVGLPHIISSFNTNNSLGVISIGSITETLAPAKMAVHHIAAPASKYYASILDEVGPTIRITHGS